MKMYEIGTHWYKSEKCKSDNVKCCILYVVVKKLLEKEIYITQKLKKHVIKSLRDVSLPCV